MPRQMYSWNGGCSCTCRVWRPSHELWYTVLTFLAFFCSMPCGTWPSTCSANISGFLLQYAVWDLAFHMLPFSRVDQEFAKKQLLLFLSDRYLHPNGQVDIFIWSNVEYRRLHISVNKVISGPSLRLLKAAIMGPSYDFCIIIYGTGRLSQKQCLLARSDYMTLHITLITNFILFQILIFDWSPYILWSFFSHIEEQLLNYCIYLFYHRQH